eukprot:g28446.t1
MLQKNQEMVERHLALEQCQQQLREEQQSGLEALQKEFGEQVAHLLFLNEDLKTADMAQVNRQLTTLLQDVETLHVEVGLRAQGAWVQDLDLGLKDLQAQVTEETARLSNALLGGNKRPSSCRRCVLPMASLWRNLRKSHQRPHMNTARRSRGTRLPRKAWNGSGRMWNGRTGRKGGHRSQKEKRERLSCCPFYRMLQYVISPSPSPPSRSQELSNAEQHAMLEERLETLEMDLAHETRRIQEQAEESLQVLGSKLSTVKENMKDREQAVLFGARCLSCNRAYEDTIKTTGSVNLPAEKRKAQVFAEIQRALHSPRTAGTLRSVRTDPQEPIKLLAVKVGRPGAQSPKACNVASRDSASMAYGIEDGMMGLCATPRPTTQSKQCNWSFGRALLPNEMRTSKDQAYEDIKSAIS